MIVCGIHGMVVEWYVLQYGELCVHATRDRRGGALHTTVRTFSHSAPTSVHATSRCNFGEIALVRDDIPEVKYSMEEHFSGRRWPARQTYKAVAQLRHTRHGARTRTARRSGGLSKPQQQ